MSPRSFIWGHDEELTVQQTRPDPAPQLEEARVADRLDSARPGDPNITDVDYIPLVGCTFSWLNDRQRVYCTRDEGHEGRQHVAEGDDTIGVLAVHPWV